MFHSQLGIAYTHAKQPIDIESNDSPMRQGRKTQEMSKRKILNGKFLRSLLY